MLAKCDLCPTTFDSHDGGTICEKCGRTYCPRCEDVHFADDVATVYIDCRITEALSDGKAKSLPDLLKATGADAEHLSLVLYEMIEQETVLKRYVSPDLAVYRLGERKRFRITQAPAGDGEQTKITITCGPNVIADDLFPNWCVERVMDTYRKFIQNMGGTIEE